MKEPHRIFFLIIFFTNLLIPSNLNSEFCISLEKEAKSIFSQLPEYNIHTQRIEKCPNIPVISKDKFTEAIQEFEKIMLREAIKNEMAVIYEQIGESDKVNINISTHIIKKTVPPNSEIITLGDIHGSIHSLLRNLLRLKNDGYIFDNLKITRPNVNFVFLGDYADKGRYGAEVWYFLMALKIHNPANVFILRGNHEIQWIAQDMGLAYELEKKYNQEIKNEIINLFDYLQVGLFIGNERKYLMFCHGGLPIKKSFSEKKIYFYRKIISFLSNNKTSCSIEDHETIAYLLFGKFIFGEEIKPCENERYMIGHQLAKEICSELNIVSVFRGHQHYIYPYKGGIPVGVLTNEIFTSPTFPYGENKMIGLYSEIPINLETEPHFVYTLASAPEGLGCYFDTEGYAIIKNEINGWTMTPYIYQLDRLRNNMHAHFYYDELGICFEWINKKQGGI